ncbi:alkaline phosphatase D family protein [Streptomyces sp. KR80]|uniref:alkaline phosphatase D family protein n=1 Tax=Streptomyces sp. KR80 TaxID=3457426 RepID=UPI003FD5B91F
MAGLLLGPLLRYVDETSATVWVETGRPCTVEVVCEGGTGRGVARTWEIAGHHYALATVVGLRPGTATPYRVLLDGVEVWPGTDDRYPPSTIRTLPAPEANTSPSGPSGPTGREPTLRVAFGSCRWAAPPSDAGHDPVGPDALDTLATRIAADPDGERPDILVLLGDQVYADETSTAIRQWLGARRDLREPPGNQVADFEEYTRLYYESWLDPDVRWLFSNVPSCMIFDDHDVIDDWNTSATWLEKMRTAPWWEERVVSGLMSYWVYQHLGNLSPAELMADPLFAEVRAARDGTALLREFATRADADPLFTRWSYRRDLGRARLLMVDTRAARVLTEDQRAMLDDREWAWLREQVPDGGPGAYDHLLIGSSLPWLLPPAIDDVERWNAALCAGERGPRWARIAEKLRQLGDLEHWSAFPRSFDALTELIARAGRGSSESGEGPGGDGGPATVCVLSGDVHHAYVAEPQWPEGEEPAARVLQLTCSPVHNSVPASMKLGFRFGWSRAGRWLGRAMARHGRVGRQGRVGPPAISWRKTGGPWFGNQLMTLTLRGRGARLRLDQARAGGERAADRRANPAAGRGGDSVPRLRTVLDTEIAPPTPVTAEPELLPDAAHARGGAAAAGAPTASARDAG